MLDGGGEVSIEPIEVSENDSASAKCTVFNIIIIQDLCSANHLSSTV